MTDARGTPIEALAPRELAVIARRADNPELLADLPDLGVASDLVVVDVEVGRSAR